MLITSDGTVIRMATSSINQVGRATQGVILMRLDEGVKVVAIARTEEKDEDEEAIAADGEALDHENDVAPQDPEEEPDEE